MITLIEALNYGCLRYVSQPLGPFHVLVGPNASGKSTFLDVVAFLGDLVTEGLDEAVRKRTANFQDLIWGRKGIRFELAVEARIPDTLRTHFKDRTWDTIRYQVAIGSDTDLQNLRILLEEVALKKQGRKQQRSLTLDEFPPAIKPPRTLFARNGRNGVESRIVIQKKDHNDCYYPEMRSEPLRPFSWASLTGTISALGNMPTTESLFPATEWLRGLLAHRIRKLALSGSAIREASGPGQRRKFVPDGSDLPWAIAVFKKEDRPRFREWLRHLRTALPDLKDIRTVRRPEDNHMYIFLCYEGGLRVPSWTASEGTLRLLALTLPAYAGLSGVHLIEEPENGIHPGALEIMMQSLTSMYGSQVLIATHSPALLSMMKPKDILCFTRGPGGETRIVSGDRHPYLKNWKREISLGALFAGGVLG